MKLGDLCDVVRGSSPRPQGDPRYFGGDIPRLMIADVTRDGKYVTPVIDSLTEEGAKKSRPMKKGDVIIAVSGDPGRPCILAVDACIHDGFVGLRNLNENKILKTYLFCFLNYFKLTYKQNAVGAIFQNLTTDQIKKIEIPEISINNQIKIVEILTQAEDLITQRQESTALLEKLLKTTFLKMFGDPVKNEKEWDIKTIEQLVTKNKTSIKRGPFGGALKKEIFVEDGYLVYEQFHALNNDFSMARYFIDEKKFNELKGFEVKPKDIIISCSGVYLGKLAIVPPNAKKGIINQALLKITLDEKIMRNQFFVFHFTHKNFKEKYFDSNRGAGVPNFPPMSDFKKFNFISPPIELQDKFITIVEKVEALRKEYEASLKELENMYGVLSQKAFKGELNLSKVNLELYKEEIKTPVAGSLEPSKENENPPVFPKKDTHIKDMTLDEYYNIPEAIIAKYGSIESRHEDWEFMLKKIFHDSPIDLSRLKEIYNKITYERGGTFNFENWKAFIFDELSKSKSFIKQKYNSETNQLELLINEIKKS